MTDYKTMGDFELAKIIAFSEEGIESHSKTLRQAKDEMLHRKRKAIAEAYAAKDSQFGVIHLKEPGYEMDVITSQRVDWDQERLAGIEKQIREEWLGDPSEYIDKKLSVKESKYKAWPSDLRATFEEARTVKASAPTLTITFSKE